MKARTFVGGNSAAKAVGFACAALLIAIPAHAQQRPKPPQIVRDIAKDAAADLGIKLPAAAVESPDQLWKQIESATAADLKFAKALADNVGSPGAKLRSACYAAWITTIEQSQGAGLKDANGGQLKQPDPHVFASFEQLAEVADNLQPTGPLMSACAPAWTALKLTAMQFFTMAVTGVTGLSALGISIP
jgi:hypothetical protein